MRIFHVTCVAALGHTGINPHLKTHAIDDVEISVVDERFCSEIGWLVPGSVRTFVELTQAARNPLHGCVAGFWWAPGNVTAKLLQVCRHQGRVCLVSLFKEDGPCCHRISVLLQNPVISCATAFRQI